MHGEAQGLGLYLPLFKIHHKDLVFFKKCIGKPHSHLFLMQALRFLSILSMAFTKSRQALLKL
jgi:hypothetical protein